MIWTLWYLDKANREHLLGAYPSAEEAHQAEREEFGHLKRASWRYVVQGYSQRQLEQLG